ncbi:MAG: Obg family GTPase CgtA, partial [Cetobacterium sp.]
MFIDEVIITVKAGNGGDGAATFRREKCIQFGGPDGGDGGKGGDLIFLADPNINTLIDFKYKKLFQAENGENGAKKNMFGKTGQDLIIKVPVGTQVREFETGKLLADLSEKNVARVFLKGGKGGLGNTNFKNSIRKTPTIATKGKEGIEIKVKLELKLLADVALVGYPSVGKSSFINKVSSAKSKVGNYHFTTLEPKLGVVRLGEERSFVIADIPGLIEGAHEGVGLGHKFLRHIERCKIIYHLVDVAGIE